MRDDAAPERAPVDAFVVPFAFAFVRPFGDVDARRPPGARVDPDRVDRVVCFVATASPTGGQGNNAQENTNRCTSGDPSSPRRGDTQW